MTTILKSVTFLFLIFTSYNKLISQTIINAYAKVTNITASKQLTISNVNTSYHSFTVGEKIIIMQMQDNVIGTTTNVSGFGNLGTIKNAGKYEIRIIDAISPASGTPTLITLSANLSNTYNVGANTSVQIISFRNLGTNYTTTSDIIGLTWNGSIGGIIAFEVSGTLTLNHSILADSLGFRGGSVSDDANENCENTNNFRLADGNKGFKGEGIYQSSDANYTNGRAKILNGGGGGSQNNTGGGGGGNYTAGGDGGIGWQCTLLNSGYGQGGLSLSGSINPDQIFMGGGGGGGQANNGLGTNGGNGGGIILVKADILTTSNTCTNSIKISANGKSAANSSNDGSGGGGAGGSVVIQTYGFSLNSTCPLLVSADGGNGGSVDHINTHGGGGGGGQGVVMFSMAQPASNITVTTTNGNGGDNNSLGNSSASPGSGTNNSGVFIAGGPLPIELNSFNGFTENTWNKLTWETATETNSKLFSIEKSADGVAFSEIGKVNAKGNSTSSNIYSYYDNNPINGENYYRLKQIDLDSNFKYSWIITVNFTKNNLKNIFPNPLEKNECLFVTPESTNSKHITVIITSVNGTFIKQFTFVNNEESNILKLEHLNLPQGIYFINIKDDYSNKIYKLIIQ